MAAGTARRAPTLLQRPPDTREVYYGQGAFDPASAFLGEDDKRRTWHARTTLCLEEHREPSELDGHTSKDGQKADVLRSGALDLI